MAVRREVVSFSQLLQQRSLSQRETPLSQRQASTSTASSAGSDGGSSALTNSYAHGGSACYSQREQRHYGDEIHGLQSRLQAPKAHCDHGTATSSQNGMHSQAESYTTRPWSQSQDETGWTGCMTSQSQSQTQTCMSQPPAPPAPSSVLPPSHNERSHQVPLHPPRAFAQHSKFSKMLLESGKLSLETSRERARSEEEMLSRLVGPVNETLKEIQTILAKQTQTQTEQAANQAKMDVDIQSMKVAINRLSAQAEKTNTNYGDCQKNMGNEAAAARVAFESMGQRMGAMERNVDVFITNMTTFVREELFALQVQRESGRTSTAFVPHSRPTAKRRLMEKSPPARRYAPLPCTTTPKNPRRRAVVPQSERGGSQQQTTVDRRRSQRIQMRREREEDNEDARDEYSQRENPETEDVFGIRLALERVEEARAKRRRLL